MQITKEILLEDKSNFQNQAIVLNNMVQYIDSLITFLDKTEEAKTEEAKTEEAKPEGEANA